MLDFAISTIVVYLIYYIFMINKYDKDGKLKKKKENKFFVNLLTN